MIIGAVTALYRYPVKGLAAETLASADVEPGGFAGDRASALFVETPGHARSGKTYRGKEQARLHTVRSVGDAQALAAGAGLAVAAVSEDDHYFDALPISIVFDTWLRDLEALTGRELEALRFRPNIVAQAGAGFTAREADLCGAELRIGGVVLRVDQPIVRCVTPSYDVATGEADRNVARVLVNERGNLMGVYGSVVEAGTISIGDAVDCTSAPEWSRMAR